MLNPITRLLRNTGYSWQGLKAVWQTEWAFRAEVVVAAPMAIIALLLPVSLPEKALLLSALLLVLLAELANTAIEVVINRISEERHPLSGKAKDIGSAMVFIALVNAGLIWLFILWGYVF